MDKTIIYSKTAKGMTELKTGSKNLVREHARVLPMINGRASVGELMLMSPMPPEKLHSTLETLLRHGMIRVSLVATHEEAMVEWTGAAVPVKEDWDEDDDALPALQVEELSPQESVQAWAQARRGATELKETGFYSYGSKGGAGAAASSGMRALIVEDDEELAELLAVLLSEKHFKVQIAGDMQQALAAIVQGQPPSLVLLDVVLPGVQGKDGFDVLGALRRQKSWANVPVVMVTSQVSDEQVMQGLKAGADGYIFKPFTWEALYGCIKGVVGI
jgi:CheY-like chemotaxis protein